MTVHRAIQVLSRELGRIVLTCGRAATHPSFIPQQLCNSLSLSNTAGLWDKSNVTFSSRI